MENISERNEIQNYWKNILHQMKNKEIDSWFYPWNLCIAKHNGLTIYPRKNLISNIGEIGVHYNNQGTNTDTRICSKIFDICLSKYRSTKNTEKWNKVLWNNFYNLQNNKDVSLSVKIFNIPVFKMKKNEKKNKIYFLGIPLLKIEENNEKKY